MRRQAGYTVYEIILTISIFIIVTAGTAAFVSGSFDTKTVKAKTLLQQVKGIEAVFANYVAVNLYNSSIFSNESALLQLNEDAMQKSGYLKGYKIKTRNLPLGKQERYFIFSDIEKELIASIFATRLRSGGSAGTDADSSSRANYRNFFLLMGPSTELAIEFYNLCNKKKITTLPSPLPEPAQLFTDTDNKKCNVFNSQDSGFEEVVEKFRGDTLGTSSYDISDGNVSISPSLFYDLPRRKSSLVISYEFL